MTNAIVEANDVDPDQQQSLLRLHRLTQRLLKHFNRRYYDKRFKDLRKKLCVSGSNLYKYSLLLLFTEMC